MRSTNRLSRARNRRRRNRIIQLITKCVVTLFIIIAFLWGLIFIMNQSVVAKYECKTYNASLYQEPLFAEDLCIVSDNVKNVNFETNDSFNAVGLLSLSDKNILYSENMHDKVYPASLSKLLTFYIASKYGNMDDIVTVSNTATILPSGSSRAWLKAGDQMTLKDLLCSMMIASGNDSAIAIAEYISGTEAAFAELMNKEARLLGATNSHFVNAHGYHDDNHYSTAYDLYLIMNACLKNETFLELISTSVYRTAITEPDGYQRKVEWIQSNLYMNGGQTVPTGITIVGGKTGTTDEAKACLMLYCTDSDSNPYVSIIMGAEKKYILYQNMTSLIASIAN